MDTSQGMAGPTGLGEKRFGSMAPLVNVKRSASTAARHAARKNTSWPGGFEQIGYAVKDTAPQRVAELAAQFGCDILGPPVKADAGVVRHRWWQVGLGISASLQL
jgi:Asp-tRNA(Asn)/Glu-tRNA(Gln) amidotransferase A subunit family amidase